MQCLQFIQDPQINYYSGMLHLSIITINFNNFNGLTKTLQSVSDQIYDKFEYIVIDGGSTDGSAEILKNSKFSKLQFVSEKDTGIYNAMNKGLKLAKGRYCLFLNSGDYLVNRNTLYEVFSDIDKEDIICGDILIEKDNKLVPGSQVPSKLTLEFLLYSGLPHPATFIKRSMLIASQGYKEEFRIISDWLFIISSIILRNATFKHIPNFISVYDTTGISSKPENIELISKEGKLAIKEILPDIVSSQLEDYSKEVMEYRKLKNNFFLKMIIKFLIQK